MSDSENSEFEDLASAIKGIGSDDEHSEYLNDDQESLDNLSEKDEDSDDEGIKSEKDEEPEKYDRRAKRKLKPENTELLDKILFGNKRKFIENLDGDKLIYEDVTGENDNEVSKELKSVWHDSDDENVSKEDQFKKRKKFERIAGNNPAWASLDQSKKKSLDDSDDDDDITRTVGHLASKASESAISRGSLLFKRQANINKISNKQGRITVVDFHPKSTVGIVAGLKGIVSLFAIDGRENKKIHNVKYERFPIYSCKLMNDEMLLGSSTTLYQTYNLMTGHKQHAFLPNSVRNLKSFQISPCGKFLGVIGDLGEVHLLHAPTRELYTTLKQENQCTSLSFSKDSNRLLSHSDDNEVTIFDMRTHRMEHRFIDDGCVNGTTLSISENGSYLATGSRQGYVNVYNYDSVLTEKYPKPLRTFDNLRTEITEVKFNPTNEILSFCSIDAENSIKMVHMSTMTVFDNFPSQHDVIGKVTTMAFSPAGGYFGAGNIAGVAPLYRLKHFNNY